MMEGEVKLGQGNNISSDRSNAGLTLRTGKRWVCAAQFRLHLSPIQLCQLLALRRSCARGSRTRRAGSGGFIASQRDFGICGLVATALIPI